MTAIRLQKVLNSKEKKASFLKQALICYLKSVKGKKMQPFMPQVPFITEHNGKKLYLNAPCM